MRVIKGGIQRLVQFVNLRIDPKNWKDQWFSLSRGKAISNSLWKHNDCRNLDSVKQLQRKMREYLTVTVDGRFQAHPRTAVITRRDLLNDLERYGRTKRFSYEIRFLEKGTDKEDQEIFTEYKQTGIRWDDDWIKIVEAPSHRSLKDYLYSTLLACLKSGELSQVQRCSLKACGKFFVTKRRGRKFCSKECRWAYNNARPDRRRQILEQRKRKRLKAKQKRILPTRS